MFNKKGGFVCFLNLLFCYKESKKKRESMLKHTTVVLKVQLYILIEFNSPLHSLSTERHTP